MARQKGLLKYVGTLSDVRHFKIKGQDGYFAGMVGGPTGEQVKTASEFERTRENMNEFGGCAKAGKSVRTALSALMRQMADSKVTGRLTSIMKKSIWKMAQKQEAIVKLKSVLKGNTWKVLTLTRIFLSTASSMLIMTWHMWQPETVQMLLCLHSIPWI